MRDANVFNLARSLPRMQRWAAKRFIRAYHGDYIAETRFQRWYLPETLPNTRPSTSTPAPVASSVQEYAGRKRLGQVRPDQPTPVTSLMLVEVERRIDVFLFRCCFATSAWQARQLVVHGKVKLNGKKHTNPNTPLNPGDLVSVNPTAIDMLRLVKSPVEEARAATASAAKTEPEASVGPATESETTTEAGSEAKSEGSEKASAVESAPAASSDSPSPTPTPAPKPKSIYDDAPKTFVNPETKATVLNHRGTSFSLPPFASPNLFIPAYIEPAFNTCSAVYVRHPTARPGYSEIPSPFGADGEVMRFAWEWYKRVRPRMRGRRERWINPSGEKGNWNMVQ